MRDDQEDGDNAFAGAIIPEDAKGGGSVVFNISLKHLLAAGAGEGMKLMGLQAGRTQIGRHESQSFENFEVFSEIVRRQLF